jgi:hypothetical protein
MLESLGFAVFFAAAFALLVGTLAISDPARVSDLVLVNDSEYDMTVYVTTDDDDGWLTLPTVSKDSERPLAHVIDHGDVWVFAVGAQGRHAGDFSMTREQLEQNGWRVAIPAEVAQALRDDQIPPTP